MTQEASMIEKIKVILKGIDQEECESAEGWWETSTGAEFGAEALKQILELVAQTQEPKIGCVNHDCEKCKTQRTWVDLTDEEIDNINYTSAHMLAREVLAKFKQKNGYAEEKNNGV